MLCPGRFILVESVLTNRACLALFWNHEQKYSLVERLCPGLYPFGSKHQSFSILGAGTNENPRFPREGNISLVLRSIIIFTVLQKPWPVEINSYYKLVRR